MRTHRIRGLVARLAMLSTVACVDGAEPTKPERREAALLYEVLPELMWDVVEGPTDGTWCLDPRIPSDVPVQYLAPDAPHWPREVIDTLMSGGGGAVLVPFARAGEPACKVGSRMMTVAFGAPRMHGDTMYVFLAFPVRAADSAGYYHRWDNRLLKRDGKWERLPHVRWENIPEIDLSIPYDSMPRR